MASRRHDPPGRGACGDASDDASPSSWRVYWTPRSRRHRRLSGERQSAPGRRSRRPSRCRRRTPAAARSSSSRSALAWTWAVESNLLRPRISGRRRSLTGWQVWPVADEIVPSERVMVEECSRLESQVRPTSWKRALWKSEAGEVTSRRSSGRRSALATAPRPRPRAEPAGRQDSTE